MKELLEAALRKLSKRVLAWVAGGLITAMVSIGGPLAYQLEAKWRGERAEAEQRLDAVDKAFEIRLDEKDIRDAVQAEATRRIDKRTEEILEEIREMRRERRREREGR